MPSLPTGTVTFLFVDLEGSTRLLEQLGDRYADVLADCRRCLRTAIAQNSGEEVDNQGDALFAAFPRARDALAAAVAAQQAMSGHPWPDGARVRARMGLHTGEPLSTGTGYVGMDVHRAARICGVGHGGQILLSHTTSELVADDLPEASSLRDLGEHGLKDLAHPQRLFQIVHPDLPRDFPPLRSLNACPNNLPRQLTSFIGREKEMAEVKRLLSTSRLVTLTGTGGAGKTRLALQAGADVLGEFSDGVWMVELAPLSDAELVPKAVASALGMPEQPDRPLTEQVMIHLQHKTLLLVLDNCEHLVAACAELAHRLLLRCPSLKILATTREALGIEGEVSYPIPPLSAPDPQRVPAVDDLARSEAVRLFTERARAALPTFRLSPANLQAVAQVCHRLDGIPLAIELAAARVKVLTVEQIAARLEDRFRLLTGGSRTTLPHHQTLRAALDWSYDLLSDQERAVLRRLSVFAGGWTLDAAEDVCSSDGLEAVGVLDLLARLVDKSLAVAETENGAARYRLLETVQQYGRDRLGESGEADAAGRRHRDWYLRFAEQAEPKLVGAEQTAWFDRLEAEHDNIRAALIWSVRNGEAATALRLVGAVWRFWSVRGYFSEANRRLQAALDASGDASDAFRAKALNGAGFLALRRGDLARARSLLEESLSLHRRLGDDAGIATSLNNLGTVALEEGDHATGRSVLDESLAIRRRLGDPVAIAVALNDVGMAAIDQGDDATARSLLEEGLTVRRQLDDKAGVAVSLNNLGTVALQQGDYVTAGSLLAESLGLCREVGDEWLEAVALTTLGDVAHAQGNYAGARSLYEESLAIARGLDDKRGMAYCFEGLARVACAQGLNKRAARLFGAAEALREAIRAPLRGFELANHHRRVALVRAGLGDESCASAWAEGRAMALEPAIQYALKKAQ